MFTYGAERHLVGIASGVGHRFRAACCSAHAIRDGSAPTANVTRSTWLAANAMARGPDAAMSIGTGP